MGTELLCCMLRYIYSNSTLRFFICSGAKATWDHLNNVSSRDVLLFFSISKGDERKKDNLWGRVSVAILGIHWF